MDPTSSVGLDGLLTNTGSFWTAALTWISSIGSAVMSSPFLQLMVIIMPVSGYAVGSIRRMIRLG